MQHATSKIFAKRYALIGLPGSGKSTFAAKLGNLLQIPVHHLDQHQFEKDGEKRDKQEFIEVQKMLLHQESWIIEGCAFSSFELRFQHADVLIYFHFSRLQCYWRLFKRLFDYNAAFGGLRVANWELLVYIWNFDAQKRARIEELRKKYSDVEFHIFRNQRDADCYLSALR